jgi:hypothetical protein
VAKLPYLYFDAASFIPNMGGVSGGPVDGVTIEDLNDDDLLDYEWMENGVKSATKQSRCR